MLNIYVYQVKNNNLISVAKCIGIIANRDSDIIAECILQILNDSVLKLSKDYNSDVFNVPTFLCINSNKYYKILSHNGEFYTEDDILSIYNRIIMSDTSVKDSYDEWDYDDDDIYSIW